MRPYPWAFLVSLLLAVQVAPLAKTVSAQSVALPHEVQGSGARSPLEGSAVTVWGVITAHTADGFFIQTVPGNEDAYPATSEGLFVLADGTSFGVGSIVHVPGTVEESQDGGGTVTQLVDVSSIADGGGAVVLPNPVVLTESELSSLGSSDQLERFEGMRVRASLRSVSAMRMDASFFAVLHEPDSTSTERPFREPGIEAGAATLPCAAAPCAFEHFDGNPERLRVDSNRLAGAIAPPALSTGATMKNVVGVLHFEVGAYTLLPARSLQEAEFELSNGMTMRPAPVTPAAEFSVASLNLAVAPDDEVEDAETQIAKASLMVRVMLNTPDIVAVQQANPAVLDALATWIDDEAPGAEPGYEAHLGAFLVKAARVTDVTTEVLAADELFQGGPLFDRAPVLLRAVVTGGPDLMPQHITVLNVQLRSNVDVHRADAIGASARAHRLAQAVRLAELVQDRNDLNEALVVVGNFNAHEFNDGYVDVTGTVSGAPASPDQVVLESLDLVTPDLTNLAGMLPAGEGYSSVARGNAQSFDHTLVSANLLAQMRGFAFARVNADFPDVLLFSDTNPGRLSDRDPSVAYFAFPVPDETAPAFDFTPEDQVVEATAPSGATVNFTVPTATDSVDGVVAVTCAPASGSVFPLGATTVTCSAQDAAGNAAEVSFVVTVRDANAPVLFVPANITESADSPAGRVVTYSVSASDAGTPSPTVVCQPASGSTFPVGTTTVNCRASDGAGNSTTASFTVTITPAASSTGGRMFGAGVVKTTAKRVAFAFDVKQSARSAERGWLVLTVKDGHGRPDWSCVAGVFEVKFSNPRGSVTYSGIGNWNGKRGYRFDVTATDRGGRNDTFGVVVKAPNGQVVLSVSGVVSQGAVKQTR